MMSSREEMPVEALPAASAVVLQAAERGHLPAKSGTGWRRLSRRMWGMPCERCGKVIWVTGPHGGWRSGGTATFEGCAG